MSTKSVSLIIPTYNNLSLLKKFLPSVLRLLRPGDELIITDDASQDKTAGWLKQKFALKLNSRLTALQFQVYSNHKVKLSQRCSISLKLVVNQTNLRFAKNVNQAVKLAKHNLIFLLNSDVQPQPGVLQVLTKHFLNKQKKPLFAVACLEYEGKDKKAAKAGKNKLWYEFGLFVHSKADNFQFGETAWASGGSAMFDREKWLELGGFDEKFYPAYLEDADLSIRAKKKGWQILFEPKAVVYHQHESTNRNVFQEKEMLKIGWKHADYFTLKHGDFWQKLAYYLWRPFWWLQRYKAMKKIDNLNFKSTSKF